MKKIVCELCEGTVFDKVDGRFVCKGCGTSYSVEEARGMMREVEGEEPVATEGHVITQSNTNQQQLDNLLMLATTAWAAQNYQQTENYCNRAIELDASFYKAWMLKGKAIGWSSNLKNNRIEEASFSFLQGISFAPSEEKESVRQEALNELTNLGLACISVRKQNFEKYPDAEELVGFVSDLKPFVNGLMVIVDKENLGDRAKLGNALADLLSTVSDENIFFQFHSMILKAIGAGVDQEFFSKIAIIMGNAAIGGYNAATNRFNSYDHPVSRDLSKSLAEIDSCIYLLRMANSASSDDDENDISRLRSMIDMYYYTLDMSCYKDYHSEQRIIELSENAKKLRREEISKCTDKIIEIQDNIKQKDEDKRKRAEEEKQARIAAYWEAHADEKASLEKELQELMDKKNAVLEEISDINLQIESAKPNGNVPSEDEKIKINDQIHNLYIRKSKLGIFAGKEKKSISEEISSLEGRLSALDAKIQEEKIIRKAEADQKIEPLNEKKNELYEQLESLSNRIDAINKELTKDPEE